MSVHLLRFPTSCSAHRSPRIPESARTTSAPGSEAARGKWLVQKQSPFFEKSPAPGSEAARDKCLVQTKGPNFEKKFCRRQRSCPGQVAGSKKVRFLRNSSAPGSEAQDNGNSGTRVRRTRRRNSKK